MCVNTLRDWAENQLKSSSEKPASIREYRGHHFNRVICAREHKLNKEIRDYLHGALAPGPASHSRRLAGGVDEFTETLNAVSDTSSEGLMAKLLSIRRVNSIPPGRSTRFPSRARTQWPGIFSIFSPSPGRG